MTVAVEEHNSAPAAPETKSRLFGVSVKVMQAAAIAASSDVARPILNTVAVFANDLVVATDSYRLAIFGNPDEKPSELIKRARGASGAARGNYRTDKTKAELLVPLDAVKLLAGITPKGNAAHESKVAIKETWTSQRDAIDREVRGWPKLAFRTEIGSMNAEGFDGDFPPFGSLINSDKPEVLSNYAPGSESDASKYEGYVCFNSKYVADIAKITELIRGKAERLSRFAGDVAVPMAFFGQHKPGGPAYFYVSGKVASLVYVLMPVRASDKSFGW